MQSVGRANLVKCNLVLQGVRHRKLAKQQTCDRESTPGDFR